MAVKTPGLCSFLNFVLIFGFDFSGDLVFEGLPLKSFKRIEFGQCCKAYKEVVNERTFNESNYHLIEEWISYTENDRG